MTKTIFKFFLLIVLSLTSHSAVAAIVNIPESEIPFSQVSDGEPPIVLAQRLGTWGRNNMWRNQQRLQQQRLRQQQMQRQRMQQQRRLREQRIRQQRLQRERMQQQRVKQQRLIRERQRRMQTQRLRLQEQRRLQRRRQATKSQNQRQNSQDANVNTLAIATTSRVLTPRTSNKISALSNRIKQVGRVSSVGQTKLSAETTKSNAGSFNQQKLTPNISKDLSQKNRARAIAALKKLQIQQTRKIVSHVKNAKISDRPPFAPGSVGAARPWSKSGTYKYHKLPTKGPIRFIPEKGWKPTIDLRKTPDGKGIIDRYGNVWKKGPSRTIGQDFEWDVQLSRKGRAQMGQFSRTGSHINVTLDGRISH